MQWWIYLHLILGFNNWMENVDNGQLSLFFKKLGLQKRFLKLGLFFFFFFFFASRKKKRKHNNSRVINELKLCVFYNYFLKNKIDLHSRTDRRYAEVDTVSLCEGKTYLCIHARTRSSLFYYIILLKHAKFLSFFFFWKQQQLAEILVVEIFMLPNVTTLFHLAIWNV